MIKNLLSLAAVAMMATSANALDLSLEDLGSGWSSSYDPETKTITYEGDWGGRGWWLCDEEGVGADFSAYTTVEIEIEPSSMICQLVVEYNNDIESTVTGFYPAGTTKISADLDEVGKGDVKQIYIQGGQLTDTPTITLVSAQVVDNSEAAPVYYEYIWTGDEQFGDDWSTFVNVGVMAFKEAQAGDKLVLEMWIPAETEVATFKFDANAEGWPVLEGMWDVEGFATEWKTANIANPDVENGATVYVAMTMTDVDAELLNANGLILQGANFYAKCITLVKNGLYAVGDFQGWDIEAPVAFEAGDAYVLKAEGINNFKISTLLGNWDIFNMAALAATGITECDKAYDLMKSSDNIMTPWAGDYTITVDNELATITFSTTTPKPEGFKEIYLRGTMNGWGAEADWKFATTDGDKYVLEGVAVTADDNWKVADETWGAINYGMNGGTVALGEPVELVYNAGDCALTEGGESLTFVFTLSNATLTVYDGAGIAGINADNAPAVYYNLQGIQVEKPEAGKLYIVKRGNKSTKEIVR